MSTLDPTREKAEERKGIRRGAFLLPSLFTVANLFCGWACVVHAMRGEFQTAAPFIGIAIVLDMLDGRIARLTGSSSEFGVEFDSLADLISFGMAPAALAFQWGLVPLGRLGWAIGFIYLAAAAVRLARFNIQPVADKRYFVGMPSPAAAGIPAATIFYFPHAITDRPTAVLALVMLLVPALLMASTFRFRSFKNLDLAAPRTSKVLVAFALWLALLAAYTEAVLMVMAYGYLVSPLIGWMLGRGKRSGPSVEAPERNVLPGSPSEL